MSLPTGTLARIDIPPLMYEGIVIETKQLTDLSAELKRWLSNLVDVLNQDLTDIEENIFPPSGGLNWNVITTASEAMIVGNGYLANRNSLIMFTLPPTSAVGDVIRVAQMNPSGSFMISQSAGQQIQLGNVTTTLGTGGSITSSAVGDSLELVCTVADTNFLVLSMMGNPTFI